MSLLSSHGQKFKFKSDFKITHTSRVTVIKINGNSSGLLPPVISYYLLLPYSPQTKTDPPHCYISIFPSSFSASLYSFISVWIFSLCHSAQHYPQHVCVHSPHAVYSDYHRCLHPLSCSFLRGSVTPASCRVKKNT